MKNSTDTTPNKIENAANFFFFPEIYTSLLVFLDEYNRDFIHSGLKKKTEIIKNIPRSKFTFILTFTHSKVLTNHGLRFQPPNPKQ